MYGAIQQHLQNELADIKEAGLYKKERIITSPQDAVIKISTGEEVINFCANNYLGLSANAEVIQAAKDAMDTHGFGMKPLKKKLPNSIVQKTLYYMRPPLMLMVVFLSHY
jgi:glycine C-acetyltransferase